MARTHSSAKSLNHKPPANDLGLQITQGKVSYKGLNKYYDVEVYLRYDILWLYKVYGTIILVII